MAGWNSVSESVVFPFRNTTGLKVSPVSSVYWDRKPNAQEMIPSLNPLFPISFEPMLKHRLDMFSVKGFFW